MSIQELIESYLDRGIVITLDGGDLKIKAPKGVIKKEDINDIKSNKRSIIAALDSLQQKDNILDSKINKIEESSDELQLSFAQQRLWLIEQIQGNSVEYNEQAIFEVIGDFDLDIATQVMQLIIERHTVLRSIYKEAEVGSRQVILPLEKVTLKIPQLDISKLSAEEQKESVKRIIKHDLFKPFNLTKDLMIRSQYIFTGLDDIGNKKGILLFNMHHIASDGWSKNILASEFVSLYKAIRLHSTQDDSNEFISPLLPLNIQYVDYAYWQREQFSSPLLEKQMRYWEKQLAELPTLHSLPLDKPRPKIKSYRGSIHCSVIDKSLSHSLAVLAKENGMTLFMLLHAGISLVLSRHSNSSDIVLGTPVANRRHSDLVNLIGFFVNTLVLRVSTDHESVKEYLAHVRDVNVEAQSHQDIPFDQLVEITKVRRTQSYAPLFQIMFDMNTHEKTTFEIDGLSFNQLDYETKSVLSQFDIHIRAEESEEGIFLRWVYDHCIFNEEHISVLNTHLQKLLASLVENTEGKLSEINMLSGKEINHLTSELNNTEKPFPTNNCIHDFFENQATVKPNAIALSYEEQQLSYKELNERANRLACYLSQKYLDLTGEQIKADCLINLYLDRSVEMVVAILAVLKAGAAFVPISPEYPASRTAYILEDTQSTLLLTQTRHIDSLNKELPAELLSSTELLAVDNLTPDIITPTTNSSRKATPNSLAYVIYTSGTTGNPKGVMIEHCALINRISWMQDKYKLTAEDTVLQKTSYSFDVSVWEFFWPLAYGSHLAVLKPVEHRDPYLIDRAIRKYSVTTLHFVPSMFQAYMGSINGNMPPSIRQIFCSGEALTSESVRLFLNTDSCAKLHNLYGPTEATIDVTYYECQSLESFSPPIGKPISNTKLFILDKNLNLVPKHSVGELYISGAGLARGYLNRPELTQKKFLSNPFSAESDSRIYKTGDLVRYLPDGNIEYIGRTDDQLKIRGFRVELGEIEAHISNIISVAQSTIMVNKTQEGQITLNGFIVPDVTKIESKHLPAITKEGEKVNGRVEVKNNKLPAVQILTMPDWIKEIYGILKQCLPEYMVPSSLTAINHMPTTINGKTDKKALPEPASYNSGNRLFSPHTETEQFLAETWAELLNISIEHIGTEANFFELGGHSLLIVKMVGNLQKKGWLPEVSALYQCASLKEMAQYIEGLSGTTSFDVPENKIPLNCERITPELLPLVALSQEEIDSIVNAIPGGAANIQDIYPLGPLQQGMLYQHCLNSESDPYVLEVQVTLANMSAQRKLESAINSVMKRYDILRTVFSWEGLSESVQLVLRQQTVKVIELECPVDQDSSEFLKQNVPAINIATGPLVQLTVVRKQQSDEGVAMLNLHHLLSDHEGLEFLQNEILQVLSDQDISGLSPTPYRNVIAYLLQKPVEQSKAYFEERLSGVSEPTAPFGLLTVKQDINAINERTIELGVELSEALRNWCKQNRITPAAFFHAASALVIAKCSGRKQVVFGTVLSGRLQSGLGFDSAMGLLINTLPLKTDLENSDVVELVKYISEELINLTQHEHMPLAEAQRLSGVTAGTPLFTSLVNYRHSEHKNIEQSEINQSSSIEGIMFKEAREYTNYPFVISVDDWGHQFSLTIEVDQQVDVERVAGYMETTVSSLLKALKDEPSTPSLSIQVLSDVDKDYLINDINSNVVVYPHHKCFHQRFENQTGQTPNACAVIHNQTRLDYQTVNEYANKLANYLIKNGVKKGHTVGVYIPRSETFLISILGIMKAGAIYVPLESDHPAKRIEGIIQQADLSFLISTIQLVETLNISQSLNWLDVDNLKDEIDTYCSLNLSVSISPEEPAYMIYTSGSTGKPKGAVVHHAGPMNHLDGEFDLMGMMDSEKTLKPINFLQSASCSFDISVWQFLAPLVSGGTTVIIDSITDMDNLANTINSGLVNVIEFTPSVLQVLLDYLKENPMPFNKVGWLILTGEPAPVVLVNQWLNLYPHIPIMNAYGPTEASDDIMYYIVRAPLGKDVKSLPIGKPLPNLGIYLLDDSLSLVPYGAVGEICVSGVGVGLGYWQDKEKTAVNFVNNPYYQEAPRSPHGKMLYKTGDLGRWLPNGHLEFLGRKDHQVKIRGLRVELGEIEAALNSLTGQSHVAVTTAKNTTSESYLVGYLPETIKETISESEIRSSLKGYLPEHMHPAYYIWLKEIPLNSAGKLDRKQLPKPDFSKECEHYIELATTTEHTLAVIWAELFDLEPKNISANANFFELGGHSLLLVKLMGQLQRHDWHCHAINLYENSTLSDMATYLDKLSNEIKIVIPENLIPINCEAITPDLLPLIKLTQEEINSIVETVPGGVKNIQDLYPLGALQQGMLFQHRRHPDSDPYFLDVTMRFKKEDGLTKFLSALNIVISRHDTLRTMFVWQGLSEPVQVVLRHSYVDAQFVDISESDDISTALSRQIYSTDISKAPPIGLYCTKEKNSEEITGLLSYHHLILDHESLALIEKEVFEILEGNLNLLGEPTPYREVLTHFTDKNKEVSKNYFTEKLSHISEVTAPFGLINVEQQKDSTNETSLQINNVLATSIRDWCRAHKLSPAIFFHTVAALVIAKCSNQTEVVFGTVLSGRLEPGLEFEQAIGLLINTLPIVVNTNSNVFDLIQVVDKDIKSLFTHEQFPLADAQRCSDIPVGTPLFTALFNYRHSQAIEAPSSDIRIQDIEFVGSQESTNYPFVISVDDFNEGFSVNIDVDQSIDSEQIAKYMLVAAQGLLEALVGTPNTAASDIQVLPVQEINSLLAVNHAKEYEIAKYSYQLFEEQALKNPAATAITHQNDRFSYQELSDQVNNITFFLHRSGVKEGANVGVAVSSRKYLIPCMLAIWKLGAVYVPISLSQPKERQEWIARDSEMQFVLSDSAITFDCCPALQIESAIQVQASPKDLPTHEYKPDQLAYVIYTSGTTGKPKGVCVEHHQLNQLLIAMSEVLRVNKDDIMSCIASEVFDISILELLLPLVNGASVSVLDSNEVNEISQLVACTKSTTIFHAVPSLMSIWLEELNRLNLKGSYDHLRTLLVGGEAVPKALLEELKEAFPHIKIIELYGPTEGTVLSSAFQYTGSHPNAQYCIGQALPHVQLMVLDNNGQVLPHGVAGELCIGGYGVARGYLNRPQLTKEKFVENSYNKNIGQYLYKTGDLVRYLPDGNLEFLGRKDDQIKIRGIRIELGEIESQIKGMDEIKDAVVVAKEITNRDYRLFAYVVPEKRIVDNLISIGEYFEESLNVTASDLEANTPATIKLLDIPDWSSRIKESIKSLLPDYMLPNMIIPIDALPLNINGKLDKKALPELVVKEWQKEYTAPQSTTENKLCQLWSLLLSIEPEQISVNADFFDLGGHSLLVVKLISSIVCEFDVELSVEKIFESRTISELAEIIDLEIKKSNAIANLEGMSNVKEFSI